MTLWVKQRSYLEMSYKYEVSFDKKSCDKDCQTAAKLMLKCLLSNEAYSWSTKYLLHRGIVGFIKLDYSRKMKGSKLPEIYKTFTASLYSLGILAKALNDLLMLLLLDQLLIALKVSLRHYSTSAFE